MLIHTRVSVLPPMRRTQRLSGAAEQLQGKAFVGFVAGETITRNAESKRRLLEKCKQRNYGIVVSSGKALSVGNSRVPRVDVQCALRIRAMCGPAARQHMRSACRWG